MPVQYKDYYAILGVPRTATQEEIRNAYRKLARQWHPDVNPDRRKEAEEKFKEINEAYQVLSDPEKRRRYDELGAQWQEYERWQRAGGEATQGPFVWRFSQGPEVRFETRLDEEDLRDLFGGESPFSEFFEQFFGPGLGERLHRRPRRGRDVVHPLRITLEEAFRGTTRTLHLLSPDGVTRRIEVRIPPGVDQGTQLRVPGQGEPGRAGGPPGDLYVAIEIEPHPRFTRQGADLRTRLQVPVTTLVLGGEVELETLSGRVTITIPPETPDGRVLRLRGQGMPYLERPDQRGDLYVEVHAEIPHGLSEREKQLYRELAALRGERVRASAEARTAGAAGANGQVRSAPGGLGSWWRWLMR
jgi:curved DNA-binding protein